METLHKNVNKDGICFLGSRPIDPKQRLITFKHRDETEVSNILRKFKGDGVFYPSEFEEKSRWHCRLKSKFPKLSFLTKERKNNKMKNDQTGTQAIPDATSYGKFVFATGSHSKAHSEFLKAKIMVRATCNEARS